jgi:hypothetical protein
LKISCQIVEYSKIFLNFLHKILFFAEKKEKKIVENFNICTNNIISVEAAKVLLYLHVEMDCRIQWNFVFNTVFLSICDIKTSGQLVEFALEKPKFSQFFCSKNSKMCRKEITSGQDFSHLFNFLISRKNHLMLFLGWFTNQWCNTKQLLYNFMTRNGLCNFHNRLHCCEDSNFPNNFTKGEFYLCLVLVELAILQTIIICVKATWAYQVARQLKFEYHNSKPPGPIIMIAQSETGTNS